MKSYVVHFKFSNQVIAKSEEAAKKEAIRTLMHCFKDGYTELGEEDIEKVTEVEKGKLYIGD